MIGAETAALTHGHELGYFPAAALVHIIHLVSHRDDISLLEAVNDSILAVRRQFAPTKHMSDFIDIMEKAIRLSKSDMDELDAIRELGEGWVAEETLAIAVYCALKYRAFCIWGTALNEEFAEPQRQLDKQINTIYLNTLFISVSNRHHAID